MTVTDRGLVVAAPLGIEAWAVRRGLSRAAVVRTGMGPARSRRAAARLRARRPKALAVAGFGGALVEGLHPGDVVVATEVRSGSSVIACSSAPLLIGALRSAGLTVRGAPVVSTDHVVRGRERADLAATGAVAVDLESATLAAAFDGVPLAVIRVIVDTPTRPLLHPNTVSGGLTAFAALVRVGPVLDRWAATVGERRVRLVGPDRSFLVAARTAANPADLVLVADSASSHTRSLVECARRAGATAYAVRDASEVDIDWLIGVRAVDLVVGTAVAPGLVGELVAALRGLGQLDVTEHSFATETVRFKLPKEVRP